MRNYRSISGLILGAAALLTQGSSHAQSPTSPSTTPASAFMGTYSFLFQGEIIAPAGTACGIAAAGVFDADGNGTITAGTINVNTAVGINLQAESVTGTYQLDATGRGSLVLATSHGPLNLNFYVPPSKPRIAVTHAALVSTNNFTGTGELSQRYDFFDNSFEYYNNNPFQPLPLDTNLGFFEESTSGGGFLPGASSLTFTDNSYANPDSISVQSYGQPIPGLLNPFSTATGTLTSPSYGRRISMTFSTPGQASTIPTHYALYGGNDFSGFPMLYLMSLDTHSSTDLIVSAIH